ncbi:MAG: carboxymuconolactone decarboxylase family protein [Acidobacteriota bacterium]
MAYIRIVDEEEAEGRLRREYETARRRAGKVFNILKIQSLDPGTLHQTIALYTSVMHGESPLSRAERELLAVVVSQVNHCHY